MGLQNIVTDVKHHDNFYSVKLSEKKKSSQFEKFRNKREKKCFLLKLSKKKFFMKEKKKSGENGFINYCNWRNEWNPSFFSRLYFRLT